MESVITVLAVTMNNSYLEEAVLVEEVIDNYCLMSSHQNFSSHYNLEHFSSDPHF